MSNLKWYWKWPVGILAIGLIAGSIGFLSNSRAAERPTEPPKEIKEAPTPLPPPSKQSISEHEAKELSESFQKIIDERERYSEIYAVAGIETKGMTFPHEGKIVKLPEDAYVERLVSEVFCVSNYFCPPTPYSMIHRNGANVILAGSIVYFAGTDIENEKAKREQRVRLMDEFEEAEMAEISKEFQFLKEIFGEIQIIQHPFRK